MGPVDVVLGQNVTLTTLLNKPEYMFIIWNFNNGKEQVHAATLTRSELKVSDLFRGRVAIDGATGSLTLGAARSADSGDYNINIITMAGDTRTAEITLRVLGESVRGGSRDPGRAPGPPSGGLRGPGRGSGTPL